MVVGGIFMVFTHLMKHGVYNVLLGKEGIGVKVRPQPQEDRMTHIYILGNKGQGSSDDPPNLQTSSVRRSRLDTH